MNISPIKNDQADTPNISSIPTDITNDGDSGNQLDSLNYTIDDDGRKLEFNMNETIDTSDNTPVGGYNLAKNIDPVKEEPEPVTTPAPEPEAVEVDAAIKITDPAKLDFIKTYTKEFDDVVNSATSAVELIIKSIDKTVREHASEIEIPEEAIQYLDDKPKENKVTKFDDAQTIVRQVMDKAKDAKSQSEQAAMEAAGIYDNIQQFKRETADEISSIRNRDEFGQPKDSADIQADDITKSLDKIAALAE